LNFKFYYPGALMMGSNIKRDWIFQLHRYIGLFVGILTAIIGLTGSILVYAPELERFLVAQKFGEVVSQGTTVEIDQVYKTLLTEAAKYPNLKIGALLPPIEAPYYQARLWDTKDHLHQIFINPYTGQAMGMFKPGDNIKDTILDLHYKLLAGDVGIYLAGIVGLLLLILSITGLVLWPGWRKLIAGFKIKWNAHIKRLHFDLHKVIGSIACVFLALTAFTGFCWNFWDWSEPVIYAATLSPKPKTDWTSQSNSGKPPLLLSDILNKANAALPGTTTWINLPEGKTGVFNLTQIKPGDRPDAFSRTVTLDQYSGKVLAIADEKTASLGDQIINSFWPLHVGTFGGNITRVLYLFVGLAPSALLVTGFVMWWHRRKPKPRRQIAYSVHAPASQKRTPV
jgi:uncharacterized iron-regulated membrane protein